MRRRRNFWNKMVAFQLCMMLSVSVFSNTVMAQESANASSEENTCTCGNVEGLHEVDCPSYVEIQAEKTGEEKLKTEELEVREAEADEGAAEDSEESKAEESKAEESKTEESKTEETRTEELTIEEPETKKLTSEDLEIQELTVDELDTEEAGTYANSWEIEGLTWVDLENDGIRGTDETKDWLLSGVQVALFKLREGGNGKVWGDYLLYTYQTGGKTENAIIESGKQLDLLTGKETSYSDGAYRFTGLTEEGTYAIRFTSGTTSLDPYFGVGANMPGSTTENDSDAQPVYEGTVNNLKLSFCYIPRINKPADGQNKIEHKDAGFCPYKRQRTELRKEVTGELGDYKKAFEFEIFLQDELGKPVKAGIQIAYEGRIHLATTDSRYGSVTAPSNGTLTFDANGKATINLSHGQEIIMLNIPRCWKIRVVEKLNPIDAMKYDPSYVAGYQETFSYGDDTGYLSPPADVTSYSIDFRNRRSAKIPATGLHMQEFWPYLMLALVMIAAVGRIVVDNRRNSRRQRR